MNINSNINIQNYNWSQVQNHIERKFEDKRLSKRQYDSNLDINWKLSQFNRSTDGHIRHDSNDNSHWVNNPREYHHIEVIKKKFIKSHVEAYIKRFNASKSVKKNPKRKIKDPLSLFSPERQRTTVDSFGDSPKNYHNIKLIQKAYKRGYKNAYIRYIKAVSYGLMQYQKDFNNRHPDIKMLHGCTNVDETTGVGRPSNKPDALHLQSNMIAFCWSKYDKNDNPAKASITIDKNGKKHYHYGAKPSFSIGRTLCHKYGLAYTKKNVSKATSKFDAEESPILCKTVSRVLADRFEKVPEFQNIVYTPKHAKVTGIDNKKLKEIYAKADKKARRQAEINRRTSQRLDNERRRIQKIKANRRRNRKRARKATLVRKRNASVANSIASSAVNKVDSISRASLSISTASNSIYSASNSVYIAESSNVAKSAFNHSLAVDINSNATRQVNDQSLINKEIKSTNKKYEKANSVESNANSYAKSTKSSANNYASSASVRASDSTLIYNNNNSAIRSQGTRLSTQAQAISHNHSWLSNKWADFKTKHMPKLYKAIGKGIKATCPKLRHFCFMHAINIQDFALGRKSWGKTKMRSGIPLFIHGIATTIKRFTKERKEIKEYKKHMPSNFAIRQMQDYINYYDESFSGTKGATNSNGRPLENAHNLSRINTLDLYNFNTEMVHNQRERNRQWQPTPH